MATQSTAPQADPIVSPDKDKSKCTDDVASMVGCAVGGLNKLAKKLGGAEKHNQQKNADLTAARYELAQKQSGQKYNETSETDQQYRELYSLLSGSSVSTSQQLDPNTLVFKIALVGLQAEAQKNGNLKQAEELKVYSAEISNMERSTGNIDFSQAIDIGKQTLSTETLEKLEKRLIAGLEDHLSKISPPK